METKNKTKFIAIFLILILLFSTTFVFADNEISEDETMAIESFCLCGAPASGYGPAAVDRFPQRYAEKLDWKITGR